eukprot:6472069-Amphidinium_carterae.2
MDDIKTQTVPKVDEDCIEHELKKRGLSYEDADKKKDKELQRLLQAYAVQNTVMLQRIEERQEQDEALPPTPEVPDTFEPLTDDERSTSTMTLSSTTTKSCSVCSTSQQKASHTDSSYSAIKTTQADLKHEGDYT